jgi:hypothetical protein
MVDNVTHSGGCHCGAIRFEVQAPADIQALSCTCSMCATTGFLHLIVTDDEFAITAGADNLSEYRFNTGVAKHLFCKTCGIKAFYVPRSHPEGWSVNVNCIDKSSITSVKIEAFDGANWEDNISGITE